MDGDYIGKQILKVNIRKEFKCNFLCICIIKKQPYTYRAIHQPFSTIQFLFAGSDAILGALQFI